MVERSSDIVERLRNHSASMGFGGCQDCYDTVMEDAADEIERLRAALQPCSAGIASDVHELAAREAGWTLISDENGGFFERSASDEPERVWLCGNWKQLCEFADITVGADPVWTPPDAFEIGAVGRRASAFIQDVDTFGDHFSQRDLAILRSLAAAIRAPTVARPPLAPVQNDPYRYFNGASFKEDSHSDPAQAVPDEVKQHIAWLFQYVQCMNERNWRDMRDNATRQLEQLSLMFPGPMVSSTHQPCPGCDGHECDGGCKYPGALPSTHSGGGK